MAANPKETTAIIRENAADHALRPLFMRFEWTRWHMYPYTWCASCTSVHDVTCWTRKVTSPISFLKNDFTNKITQQ